MKGVAAAAGGWRLNARVVWLAVSDQAVTRKGQFGPAGASRLRTVGGQLSYSIIPAGYSRTLRLRHGGEGMGRKRPGGLIISAPGGWWGSDRS